MWFLGDRLSQLGSHTSDGIGIVNLLLVLWPNHQSFSSNRWCGHFKQTDVLEVALTWIGQLYFVAPAALAVYLTVSECEGIGNKGIGKNFKSAVCLCLGRLRVGFYYWVD